jgi:hypothetical protein
MNSLISFALKQNKLPIAKMLWKIQSCYSKKYEQQIWLDKNSNSLAHYACLHHNTAIWEFVKTKPLDLTHINNEGKAPIHIFIERSFVQDGQTNAVGIKQMLSSYWISFLNQIKFLSPHIEEFLLAYYERNNKSIAISFNKVLLKDLISSGGDINQFIKYPDRTEGGWESTDYGSFSIKHILGTPLELLVSSFWYYIPPLLRNESNKLTEEYYEFFHTLTSLGANPNLIIQGNTNNEEIKDAMSSFPSRVVSIFFTKFIASEADYYAIKPFFNDEHIDFMAIDDMGNSVLHTLFARMSARKHRFSDELCESIIKDLTNNKNLTLEALALKNYYHLTPYELLREEAKHLRKYLDVFTLKEDLGRNLEINSEVKKKKAINKI